MQVKACDYEENSFRRHGYSCKGWAIFLKQGKGKKSHMCKDSRKIENKRWSKILTEMGTEIPVEYKSEWKKIVSEKPESLMNAISIANK